MKHCITYLASALLSICTSLATAQQNPADTSYPAMMNKLGAYADSYKPSYIEGNDTLAISIIGMPPADINRFLFSCIKANNTKPLKYVAAIFVKQHNEYMKVNHQDFQLADSTYAANGIVEMMRAFMGLGRKEAGIQNIEDLYTADICQWIDGHAKKIEGFDYVKQFEVSGQ